MVFLSLYCILKINSLVYYNERVVQSESNISIALQRKYDLLINLINISKEYAIHESDIYNKIVESRERISLKSSIDEKEKENKVLSDELGNLKIVLENYPTLTSSEIYKNLMVEIEGSDNRISIARNDYNKAVQKYNTALKTFPGILFAKIMNFSEKKYFEVDSEVINNKIKFDILS